jgi:AAA15 family ATPase/GTPase
MKLVAFHVHEYKSARDSNSIAVGDVTCIVGKNESGKSILLQALYKLNPIIAEHGNYDVVDEYPRADVEDYRQALEAEQRKPATVVTATFELDVIELEPIEKELGKGVIADKRLTVSKGYDNTLVIGLTLDERIAGTALLSRADMAVKVKPSTWKTLEELETAWQSVTDQKTQAFNEAIANLPNITDPLEKKKAETAARQLEETNGSKQGRASLTQSVNAASAFTFGTPSSSRSFRSFCTSMNTIRWKGA